MKSSFREKIDSLANQIFRDARRTRDRNEKRMAWKESREEAKHRVIWYRGGY